MKSLRDYKLEYEDTEDYESILVRLKSLRIKKAWKKRKKTNHTRSN